MAPLYKPPTRVATREFPYLAIVSNADPTWQKFKHREVEYEFAGRRFLADPYVRGIYNSNSNIYPVGQPFGGQDAAVVAARPLFSGTPDGKGWA